MTTANVIPNVASGFNQLFGNYIDAEIYKVPKPENFILGLVDTQIAPGTENIWYVQTNGEWKEIGKLKYTIIKTKAD